MQGLNVSRIIRIAINLSPLAAARRVFGVICILGDSDVIDGLERIREYTSASAIAADFGAEAPETLAGNLYFAQEPRPLTATVARWLRTATAGFVKGSTLSTVQQTLATWTAIADGSFRLAIDGAAAINITGIDLTGALNLNGVATAITAELGGAATCTWDGSRFRITSDTTGEDSSVSYLTTATASVGTDISTMLRMTAATATSLVPGYEPETAVEAATAIADKSGLWYGLMFAAGTMPSNDALVEVGTFIETTGATLARIFGVVETNSNVLDAETTTDLASRLMALGYTRSCVLYSSTSPYAMASFLGRAFSVDFNAKDSVLTMMFKTLPGVVAEYLTDTQATVLENKRCNVYVNYANGDAIVQHGVMSGDAWFDERHNLDWFGDALQNAFWNRMRQAKRKLPQTNSGYHELVNAATHVCGQALNNGMIAGGQWNADAVGSLENGDPIPNGFHINAPLLEDQDQSEREQRIAPPMQIALKLAGAFHKASAVVDVNR